MCGNLASISLNAAVSKSGASSTPPNDKSDISLLSSLPSSKASHNKDDNKSLSDKSVLSSLPSSSETSKKSGKFNDDSGNDSKASKFMSQAYLSDESVISQISSGTESHLQLAVQRRDTGIFILQCEYCHKRFTDENDEEIRKECKMTPNKFRTWVDHCCCVKPFQCGWYHLSKDQLEDGDFDIGSCGAPDNMPAHYWCLVGFLSCLCLPCLSVWCPLNICAFCTEKAGVVGTHCVSKVYGNDKDINDE